MNQEQLNHSLFKFSALGNLEIIKYLVEKGADIHALEDYALRWAACSGHLEVVKYLVSKGADIHAGNNRALRYANDNDHIEIVKYLESLK